MTIQLVSTTPSSGSVITSSQAVVFEIRSDVAFRRIVVSPIFPGMGFTELAYAQDPAGVTAGTFEPVYVLSSTMSVITDPGWFHYKFTLLRCTAWPDSPQLQIFAYDTAGVELVSLVNWLVIDPPPPVPGVSTQVAMPPMLGSSVDCNAPLYDQTALLRVIDRSYPQDYVGGLKSKPNGGYEIFQAATKVGERTSLAVARLYCCAFLMSAEGGAKASGEVEFYRPSSAAGAITVKAGSVVGASASNRNFVTTEDAVFGSSALGPITVGVSAIDFGYEYNLPGQVVTAGNEVLPGEIDRIVKLNGDAPDLDIVLAVRQIAPTVGGRAACLDGLAKDLNLFRQVAETDDVFRLRVIETPDTVSPLAILRGVNKLLNPLGADACLREIGTTKFPGWFYDAPASGDPTQNYAWDMDFSLRPVDRFKLFMSRAEMRGFFLIGVPPIVEQSFGFVYDGTSGDAFPLKNAYDTTAPDAQSSAYDGFQRLSASLYQSIWSMIDAKRAGGVQFDLYLETIDCN